jgi:acetyltransferase-like isoleucine patch superfamily enzyme
MSSFYSIDELANLGLKSYGSNVLISRKCSIYGAQNISIGDNVRIDDFVILSIGNSLIIGNYVHIACYASIIGVGKIIISDYCGLSGRVSVYSSSDDYSGIAMTNPMIPQKYTNVTSGPVTLGNHVIIGCSSVILPNSILEEGVAVGAMSVVQGKLRANYIYSGNPVKKLMPRSLNYKELQAQFENELINKTDK